MNSTFLMFDPPFPMMFLWNCLKMGTETEKLFSTWEKQQLKVNTGPYKAMNAILKLSLNRHKYLRWNTSKYLPSQPLSSAWT